MPFNQYGIVFDKEGIDRLVEAGYSAEPYGMILKKHRLPAAVQQRPEQAVITQSENQKATGAPCLDNSGYAEYLAGAHTYVISNLHQGYPNNTSFHGAQIQNRPEGCSTKKIQKSG